MNWHEISRWVIIVGIVLLVVGLGFLAGHKWRRDYSRAVSKWEAALNSAAKATASSSAVSYGNQVVLNVDSGRQQSSDSREFWLPSAVRGGLDSGSSDRTEALTSGDNVVISEPDIVYRPSRLSRLLLGDGRSGDGHNVGRAGRTSGGGGELGG